MIGGIWNPHSIPCGVYPTSLGTLTQLTPSCVTKLAGQDSMSAASWCRYFPVTHSPDGSFRSRYITSVRGTYFRPFSTGAPSCSNSWLKTSAFPCSGQTINLRSPDERLVKEPILEIGLKDLFAPRIISSRSVSKNGTVPYTCTLGRVLSCDGELQYM